MFATRPLEKEGAVFTCTAASITPAGEEKNSMSCISKVSRGIWLSFECIFFL